MSLGTFDSNQTTATVALDLLPYAIFLCHFHSHGPACVPSSPLSHVFITPAARPMAAVGGVEVVDVTQGCATLRWLPIPPAAVAGAFVEFRIAISST